MTSLKAVSVQFIWLIHITSSCLVPCDEECRRLGNPIFRPRPTQYVPKASLYDLDNSLFQWDSRESDSLELLPLMKIPTSSKPASPSTTTMTATTTTTTTQTTTTSTTKTATSIQATETTRTETTETSRIQTTPTYTMKTTKETETIPTPLPQMDPRVNKEKGDHILSMIKNMFKENPAARAQDDINQQGRSQPERSLLTHKHYTRFGTITGRIKYTDSNQLNNQLPGQVPSTAGEYFFSFTGIPYATPPVGNRRLQEAEPVYSWHGDLDATRTKLGCPRTGGSSIGITEDCLYLNVFTKNLIKTQRNTYEQSGVGGGRQQSVNLPLRPVIVFLPGFENEAGAGEFGANRIMREDVVVVTVEYRVGLLGFLSDETKRLPGNLGMVDVQLALGWVQQAIADFGGNPQSVTLAGYGQGAVIAHLLTLNPGTSNLFQKLILQSGSSLCDGSVSVPSSSDSDSDLPSPYYTYKKVLYSTECSNLKCLQDKPLQDLLNAQTELEKENVKIFTVFTPIVDQKSRRNPLVPTDPRTLDQSLISRSVPLMIGSSQDEGLSSAIAIYLKNQGQLTSPETLKKEVLPKLMVSLLGPRKGIREELIEAAFRQYFTELRTGGLEDIVSALGEMLGDVLVNSCIRETVLLHREHSSSPVYSYIFAHAGGEVQSSLTRSLGRMTGLFSRQTGSFGGMGQWSGHIWRGDDLLYLWQLESQPDSAMRLEDKLVSQNLTTMWASFAKSGSPQPFPRFSETLLQSQSNQPQDTSDWMMVESRGPISYYNISLQQAGMYQDYRKTQSVFWQYQMKYFEKLSVNSAAMKGYAVATWILGAVFFIVLAVVGTGLFHLRKQHKRNEKALQGRDYNSWVSNMNNLKNAENSQNNYEIK